MASNTDKADAKVIELSTEDVIQDIENAITATVSDHNGGDSTLSGPVDSATSISTNTTSNTDKADTKEIELSTEDVSQDIENAITATVSDHNGGDSTLSGPVDSATSISTNTTSNTDKADTKEIEFSTEDVSQDIENASTATVSDHNGGDSTFSGPVDSATSISTNTESDSLTTNLQKVAEKSESLVYKGLNARRLCELMIFNLQSLKNQVIIEPHVDRLLNYVEGKLKLNEEVASEFREFTDEVVSVLQHVDNTGTSHLPFENRTAILINLLIVRQQIEIKLKWLNITAPNVQSVYSNLRTMGIPVNSPHLNRFIIVVDRIKIVLITLKVFIKKLEKCIDVASTLIESIQEETGVKVEGPISDSSAQSPKN